MSRESKGGRSVPDRTACLHARGSPSDQSTGESSISLFQFSCSLGQRRCTGCEGARDGNVAHCRRRHVMKACPELGFRFETAVREEKVQAILWLSYFPCPHVPLATSLVYSSPAEQVDSGEESRPNVPRGEDFADWRHWRHDGGPRGRRGVLDSKGIRCEKRFLAWCS